MEKVESLADILTEALEKKAFQEWWEKQDTITQYTFPTEEQYETIREVAFAAWMARANEEFEP